MHAVTSRRHFGVDCDFQSKMSEASFDLSNSESPSCSEAPIWVIIVKLGDQQQLQSFGGGWLRSLNVVADSVRFSSLHGRQSVSTILVQYPQYYFSAAGRAYSLFPRSLRSPSMFVISPLPVFFSHNFWIRQGVA